MIEKCFTGKKNKNMISRIDLVQGKEIDSVKCTSHKRKDDFIADFDINEKSNSLFALTNYGCLHFKPFCRDSSEFTKTWHEEYPNHQFVSIRISKDSRYLVIGSYEKKSSGCNIYIDLYEMGDSDAEKENTAKLKKWDTMSSFISNEATQNDQADFPKYLDLNLTDQFSLLLTIFFKNSSNFFIHKIKNNKIVREPILKTNFDSGKI